MEKENIGKWDMIAMVESKGGIKYPISAQSKETNGVIMQRAERFYGVAMVKVSCKHFVFDMLS